jgi:hypothetical protein
MKFKLNNQTKLGTALKALNLPSPFIIFSNN